MNKEQLVAVVAQKINTTKKASDEAVTAVLQAIEEALVNKEKVSLTGFGTFSVKDRAERNGRNPATKEPMVIPATVAPHWKAGKVLSDKVKGK